MEQPQVATASAPAQSAAPAAPAPQPVVEAQGKCLFNQPPVRRTYCLPAPVSRADGAPYHRIVNAYGVSRPLNSL